MIQGGMRAARLATLLALALGWTGCAHREATTPVGPVPEGRAVPEPATGQTPRTEGITGELTVLVPCGLAGPYGEVKDLFEAKHPGLKLHQTVDSTNVLTREVADGTRSADVLISLGDREGLYLKEHGKVLGEPVDFAQNALGILVPMGNPANIEKLQDVASDAVKSIAIAASEVNSNGYYAQQAFERAGLWEKIKDRTIRPDKPSEIGQLAAQKKIQVGVVYASCLLETKQVGGKPTPRKKTKGLFEMPQKYYDPIHCQALVLTTTTNETAARAFCDLFTTDAVQEILEKWGLKRLYRGGQRVTEKASLSAEGSPTGGSAGR